MKKICIIAVALLIFSGGIGYAGQFGAPEPLAKEGKVAFGIGYFYSNEKLKPSDDAFLGTADFWQKARFMQNTAYLQGSYGIFKNWEVFGRLGFADLQASDTFNWNTYTDDFKDTYQVFGTLGIKGVMYSNPSFAMGPFSTFSIGPILKGSYYSDYQDSAMGAIGGTAVTMTYSAKDMWDASFALAMQTKLNSVILYAGPFAYWRNIKSELTVQITGTGIFTDSTKYESENNVGGFAGIRVPIMKNVNFELEGQYTNSFSAGAAVVYSF